MNYLLGLFNNQRRDGKNVSFIQNRRLHTLPRSFAAKLVTGLRETLNATAFLCFSMKKGRVVILLAGRHAGKKAVIVKQNDEGRKVSGR